MMLYGLGIYYYILIAAAIIPAIALMIYVYKTDKLEKEPPKLIVKLVALGAVSTLIASLLEQLGLLILGSLFRSETLIYRILLYFVVVAFAEEGSKYFILKKVTWKNPEFNCRYDGVVYAVAVSLGFALWENIKYVVAYGFGTAMVRALTAVPGHACFGVLMGFWYGLAKKKDVWGLDSDSKLARRFSVLMPALVHGLYDFIATCDGPSTLFFIVFIILMFIVCFNSVKKLSDNDEYL